MEGAYCFDSPLKLRAAELRRDGDEELRLVGMLISVAWSV